jgi:hypothetical protein
LACLFLSNLHRFTQNRNFFQIFLSFFGVFNMLRGLFIFLVFIWKPSIWKMIERRHPWATRIYETATKLIFRKSNSQDNISDDTIARCSTSTISRQNVPKSYSVSEQKKVCQYSVKRFSFLDQLPSHLTLKTSRFHFEQRTGSNNFASERDTAF